MHTEKIDQDILIDGKGGCYFYLGVDEIKLLHAWTVGFPVKRPGKIGLYNLETE